MSGAASAGGGGSRLPPEVTIHFGVQELHGIWLQHRADPGGPCVAVSVSLPEASRADLLRGLALARRHRARLQVIADTREQALSALRLALRRCPDHRPVAPELVAAGAWGARRGQ